jgi:divalent metal cation (Fe/Co/Zn/Cd) transporter
VLDRIVAAIEDGGPVHRVIHIRTQYLGPDELLVAAKIGLDPCVTVEDVAQGIDAAEQRVRSAVPEARLIYLEPDLDRSAVRG